jgi:putative hydrolase of the HAD superfamily
LAGIISGGNSMGVEAVIWDFGGVFTSSPFEAFNRYEAEKGLPRDLIRTVNATNPDTNAWALFERAEVDSAGFDRLFHEESSALGHPVPGREVLPLLSGHLRPAMVDALLACKARFKVGCITNNMASSHSPGSESTMVTAMGRVMPHFHAIIES